MEFKDRPTGMDVLRDPRLNKGSAFTARERDQYRLHGLLPPAVSTQEVQLRRVMDNLRRKDSDLERYILLQALQGRNERLFYRVVLEHIDEVMPLIYTPTVGQASKEYAHIFRRPSGFYVSANDRGRIRQLLDNWPHSDVRIIVVTDGERILGLGDLGANGMGIALGKLSLYTACAGIDPQQCMPLMLDVGTDNQQLREDPLYLGLRSPRLRGDAYLDLIAEFVAAVREAFPGVLIHFEDFASDNAHRLLDIYRHDTLCMNDDIQGTAVVTLAGLRTAADLAGQAFRDLRVLFLGAGSAALGIADLLVDAFMEAGLAEHEARSRIAFVDKQGLLVKDRADIGERFEAYAQDRKRMNFVDAVRTLRPHALIGATGAAGTFSEEVIRLMAQLNARPIIFPLSNPTANAECTAEQAYAWTEGKALFASGSPFGTVRLGEQTFRPAQCNNVYVFPGVGLGALVCQAARITDRMLLAAATALQHSVDRETLQTGALYPPLRQVRAIAVDVAKAVIESAVEEGVAQNVPSGDITKTIAAAMYQPCY